MRRISKRNESIVVLTIFGVLALNYPWLSLFSHTDLVFGIPILYLYLFILWGIFIIMIAMLIEGENIKDNAPPRKNSVLQHTRNLKRNH